ncbi:MAG: alpha/beta fold hydrolase [Actinomycetota bacterium]|nr:alpha/beta fold hydrolase [Actinomycetota bacterium]
MISEELRFRARDGLELEGVLDLAGPPPSVLLLCHPHPQMGGTMNAPLLLAVRDELIARRWGVLRFNFRGIGASEGESSDGGAEIADVEGGIALLRERFPGVPVALAGWSFGAAVAIRVACRGGELAACVAIAPAVTPKPGVSAGVPAPDRCRLPCPLLIITGANDDQVRPEECKAWAGAVENATYIELPGANHFFWAKYDALASRVGEFLDTVIWKEA